MSSKSTLAKYTETMSTHEEECYKGQDIFVEGDPALSINSGSKFESGSSEVVDRADLRKEKLSYIHEILLELRKLSASIEQPMVNYLLDMALLETDTAMNITNFENEFGNS